MAMRFKVDQEARREAKEWRDYLNRWILPPLESPPQWKPKIQADPPVRVVVDKPAPAFELPVVGQKRAARDRNEGVEPRTTVAAPAPEAKPSRPAMTEMLFEGFHWNKNSRLDRMRIRCVYSEEPDYLYDLEITHGEDGMIKGARMKPRDNQRTVTQ